MDYEHGLRAFKFVLTSMGIFETAFRSLVGFGVIMTSNLGTNDVYEIVYNF